MSPISLVFTLAFLEEFFLQESSLKYIYCTTWQGWIFWLGRRLLHVVGTMLKDANRWSYTIWKEAKNCALHLHRNLYQEILLVYGKEKKLLCFSSTYLNCVLYTKLCHLKIGFPLYFQKVIWPGGTVFESNFFFFSENVKPPEMFPSFTGNMGETQFHQCQFIPPPLLAIKNIYHIFWIILTFQEATQCKFFLIDRNKK